MAASWMLDQEGQPRLSKRQPEFVGECPGQRFRGSALTKAAELERWPDLMGSRPAVTLHHGERSIGAMASPKPSALPTFNPPGHYAPDEVPGAKAVLHEHQLGAGEFQQVGGGCALGPQSCSHFGIKPSTACGD